MVKKRVFHTWSCAKFNTNKPRREGTHYERNNANVTEMRDIIKTIAEVPLGIFGTWEIFFLEIYWMRKSKSFDIKDKPENLGTDSFIDGLTMSLEEYSISRKLAQMDLKRKKESLKLRMVSPEFAVQGRLLRFESMKGISGRMIFSDGCGVSRQKRLVLILCVLARRNSLFMLL